MRGLFELRSMILCLFASRLTNLFLFVFAAPVVFHLRAKGLNTPSQSAIFFSFLFFIYLSKSSYNLLVLLLPGTGSRLNRTDFTVKSRGVKTTGLLIIVLKVAYNLLYESLLYYYLL